MKIESVLVVDDSEPDQIIAKFAIQAYDPAISIETAYDGQEALDLLAKREQPPSFILLDINMPGMNGHEFLEQYAKTARRCVVVAMLTSSDNPRDKASALGFPFVRNFVVKPVDAADIKSIVASL